MTVARRALTLLAVAALAGCSSPRPASPRLLVRAPGPEHPTGRVELRASGAAPDSLRVRVAGAPADAPDVLGEARAADAALVFTPRFPLQRGLAYEVSAAGAEPVALEFTLPAPRLAPEVTLVAVYPDAPVLPANLLKLYLHFSGPMRRGEAYRRARLRDASGAVVEGAFLEVEPELWNPERTRLTLLIDPGRIKRGLVPHEELGPVLYPEREYVLEVDAAWRDDRGAPLRAGLRRAFRTGPADLGCPAPALWQLAPPRAGTREPLAVRFDEVLDRALVERLLAVEGPDGAPLDGHGAIDADQAGWRFVPARAWRAAPHALVAPAVLEDLVGNSIGRPFEVDGPAAREDALADRPARRAFTPR